MKHYPEWKELQFEVEKTNSFTAKFIYPNGDTFYVEPVYYYKLRSLYQHHSDRFNEILLEMERIVHKYHKVVFINDEDEEITEVDGAVYLTIQDVCDPLQIFVEDKSRGSDYGD